MRRLRGGTGVRQGCSAGCSKRRLQRGLQIALLTPQLAAQLAAHSPRAGALEVQEEIDHGNELLTELDETRRDQYQGHRSDPAFLSQRVLTVLMICFWRGSAMHTCVYLSVKASFLMFLDDLDP